MDYIHVELVDVHNSNDLQLLYKSEKYTFLEWFGEEEEEKHLVVWDLFSSSFFLCPLGFQIYTFFASADRRGEKQKKYTDL